MILTCSHIEKTFVSKAGDVRALDGISFSLKEGEFMAIVGPSGCGKSTLLRIIAGLTPLSGGELHFAAGENGGQPQHAMVFQEHALFPWMNIVSNVAFGLETQDIPEEVRIPRAMEALAMVGIDDFARYYPHELSGGMCQRAALARAFLRDPAILLMDEPFGSLDAQTRLILQQELLNIWEARRTSVILVTHDIEEAILLSDRILVLSGRPGKILDEIEIPLSRPRRLEGLDDPAAREIKWHIWDHLKNQLPRLAQQP